MPPEAFVSAASAPIAGLAGARGCVGEHLHRPAAVDRVAHELLALGDEKPALVAMLLLLQRADLLHERIGEARDLLEAPRLRQIAAHGAVQREKSEVASSPPL